MSASMGIVGSRPVTSINMQQGSAMDNEQQTEPSGKRPRGIPIDAGKLDAAMRAAGVNATQLAEQIGKTPGYVRLLKRGIRWRPDVSILRAIERALSVELGALDRDSTEPPETS